MDIKKTVYVANLPDTITEDQIKDLFSKYGEIATIELFQNTRTGTRSALVEMTSEKPATKARNSLNGYDLEGLRIAVSPPDVPDRNRMSNKQQRIADRIVKELGEEDEVPIRQINAMVMLCGTNFAEALLEETKAIEAGDGILTSDGERRRTIGGVFFYLARHRMSHPLRRIVYNRKGKMPGEDDQDENGTG